MAHVSLITLGVDDLAAATRFYEALGWSRSPASVDGEVAFMIGGTVVLGLFGRDDLARDAEVEAGEPGSGTIALASNLPSEQAVDDVLATAQTAGGRITKRARRADWGGYSGYFADPDGHLWEVAFNPGFALQPDGRVILPAG